MRTAIQHAQRHVSIKSNGCWEWTSCRVNGYPRVRLANRTNVSVHREIYKGIYGYIEGQVHHLCENRTCINPSHLVDISSALHSRVTPNSATYAKRNATHCPAGHLYSGSNLVEQRRASGQINRKCRECIKAKNARQYAKRKGNLLSANA